MGDARRGRGHHMDSVPPCRCRHFGRGSTCYRIGLRSFRHGHPVTGSVGRDVELEDTLCGWPMVGGTLWLSQVTGGPTTGCRRRRACWEVVCRHDGRSPTAPEPERWAVEGV